MNTIDEEIRKKIKARMFLKRLTQKALADQLEIKQQSVGDIITGKRGLIPQSLIDLLEILELDIVLKEKK